MSTHFITNEDGHLIPELTDDYKKMMDGMLDDEVQDVAEYVSFEQIKNRFQRKLSVN